MLIFIISCVPDTAPSALFRRALFRRAPGDFSTTGACGPNNGGTICNPAATTYSGSCCSVSSL